MWHVPRLIVRIEHNIPAAVIERVFCDFYFTAGNGHLSDPGTALKRFGTDSRNAVRNNKRFDSGIARKCLLADLLQAGREDQRLLISTGNSNRRA